MERHRKHCFRREIERWKERQRDSGKQRENQKEMCSRDKGRRREGWKGRLKEGDEGKQNDECERDKGRVMEGWKEREVKVIARQNRSTKPSEQRRY